MSALHDMHCHLDFMTNAEEVAADARAQGSLLFANTVTPDEWELARTRFADFENVTVGFGMHPWWVKEDDTPDTVLAILDQNKPAFLGEVGLDLGKRHAATQAEQRAIFRAIARWAAHEPVSLISIHSVHAAAEVLDVLESEGALGSCPCVFHWFTGPSDQLKRAIEAGCYFSIGPRMLATGKGREYIKAIPLDQMLLETDAPPKQGHPYSYEELECELKSAASAIEKRKGKDALERMSITANKLLERRIFTRR